MFGIEIGDFVGEGLFFEHVSARAAYMLPAHHDRGLVKGSGFRSTQGRSSTGFYAEYFEAERSVNWNGYTDTTLDLALNDRVLLDVVPNLHQLGPITVARSTAVAHALLDGESEAALSTPAAINDTLLPVGAAAVFPAFDLFASALHLPQDSANPGSWPAVQLLASGDVGAGVSTHYPMTGAIIPRTGSADEKWALWMKVAGAVPADSGVAIWGAGHTLGK